MDGLVLAPLEKTRWSEGEQGGGGMATADIGALVWDPLSHPV